MKAVNKNHALKKPMSLFLLVVSAAHPGCVRSFAGTDPCVCERVETWQNANQRGNLVCDWNMTREIKNYEKNANIFHERRENYVGDKYPGITKNHFMQYFLGCLMCEILYKF